MRRAVIDVGSNSVLLTVGDAISDSATQVGSWQTVFETSAVTALGRGTKETGLLGENEMTFTLLAVAKGFSDAKSRGATEIVAAATMAARIATNTPDFLARARAQQTPIHILSGEQEADLGFLSVAHDPLLAQETLLSIIDPGGHSTELVTAEKIRKEWNIKFRRSFPIGSLGLKGGPLKNESCGPAEILAASCMIDDAIGLCYRRGQAGRAVVLGAAVTNLVSIKERMLIWDAARVHGAYLNFEEISRAVGELMPMTDQQRRELVGLEPGREQTIQSGALIVERFLAAIGVAGCTVSVRGWRHALLERLDFEPFRAIFAN